MDGELGLVCANYIHLEWVSNGMLLYSTGSYVQFPGIDNDGIWSKRGNVKKIKLNISCP